MNKLNVLAVVFAMSCLPMMGQKASEGVADKPDPNFQIYLCFGQSNMEGNAAIEHQDSLGIDSRFLAMYAVDDDKLGWKKGEWHVALPPQTRPTTGLTPVDYFGRKMVAYLPDSVRVGTITVAVGGASIDLFDKRTYKSYLKKQPDWMKQFASQYNGNPYGRLIELAKIAQKQGVIKGILLHQGETNNGDKNWPNRVKTIYHDILKALNLKAEDVPLLVGETVQESRQIGARAVILVLANWVLLLSSSLGIMNLLPIPALDGGRLVFLFIELVRGKPVDPEKEGMVHMAGMAVLMALMILVLFNDIRNLM